MVPCKKYVDMEVIWGYDIDRDIWRRSVIDPTDSRRSDQTDLLLTRQPYLNVDEYVKPV